MAAIAQANNLFGGIDGWSSVNRPAPYDSWGTTTKQEYESCYHHESSSSVTLTAGAKPEQKLQAYIVKALLSVVSGKTAEIGICKAGAGSYAVQHNRPDGTTLIASINVNGELKASIIGANGKFSNLPCFGSKDLKFDTSPLFALVICMEADRSKANGNPSNAITWELLNNCKEVLKTTGVMDERTVYLVNDAVYYGLKYAGCIPCTVQNGNISVFTKRRLDVEEYASAEVICGNPDLLVKHDISNISNASIVGSIGAAKEKFKEYIASRTWTDDEEAMIPVFPDDMPVPEQVMKIARRFVKSRGFKVPIDNMCWRGSTGFGKSTGAEILACILHTPFVRITCSSQTELDDFLAKFVPNSDCSPEALSTLLPTLAEINLDPVGAFEKLTGRIVEDVTPEQVMECRDEALISRGQASHFKLVVSPYVTALEKGWVVEVSEFGRIRDSGILSGLNNFDKPGSLIPLPTGGYVLRHHDALTLWTDNVGYVSCRPVDPAVRRRMAFIIDSYELTKEETIARIVRNTGFDDAELLNKMYEIWRAIRKHCEEKEITEGDISIVELERWVQLVQIDGEEEIFESCREAVASKASSDPSIIQEIMDGPVTLAMASNQTL